MQGGRGRGDPFSDFGGFGGFDPFAGFGGFGGFGGQRSLLSGFFEGRDPFDDPFFTRPLGGMFGSSLLGPMGSPFEAMHPPSAYLEQQAPEPKKSRGPIIEELDSDDEGEKADKEKEDNPRKQARLSKEPYVVDLDDTTEERRGKQLQSRNDYNKFSDMGSQPQVRSFSFQSSTVSYGGANGTYYTSSTTRRTGSDGVTFEESKEADSATRQAMHRVSRGIHNKGHTHTRKLNSDGKVDKMETLHNLGEDELAGFEEAWRGKARQCLPGQTGSFSSHGVGVGGTGQNAQSSGGGWALPSSEQSLPAKRTAANATNRAGSSNWQHSGRVKGSSNVTGKSGNPRWRERD